MQDDPSGRLKIAELNFQEFTSIREYIRPVPKFEVKEATPCGTWINDNRQLDGCFENFISVSRDRTPKQKGKQLQSFLNFSSFFSLFRWRTLVDSIDIITPMETVSHPRSGNYAWTWPLNISRTSVRRIERSLAESSKGFFARISGRAIRARITPGPLNGKITFLLSTLHQRQILARSLVIFCFFVSGYYSL